MIERFGSNKASDQWGSGTGTLNCPDTQLYSVGIGMKSDGSAATQSFRWQPASFPTKFGE